MGRFRIKEYKNKPVEESLMLLYGQRDSSQPYYHQATPHETDMIQQPAPVRKPGRKRKKVSKVQ